MTERTAVVTGAASARGIGRATTHALAAQGWAVAVLDLDADGAAKVADDLARTHGVDAAGIGCDITDTASITDALAAMERDLPAVGALVNNAGITSPTAFLEVTDEEWDRIHEVNLRGAYLLTRRLAPGMVDRGFGRIVHVSSVSAQRGGGVFGGVAYSASKAALLGFARALARELGPQGVTVNAVAPGLIDTDITGGALSDERRRELEADVPVGRSGSVDDVADLVAFLCRPGSGYLTGATYDVNGGSHIH